MKKTKVVKVGNLKIGGNNPVRIKAMLKTPAKNTAGLIREAKLLEKEGAEAIRVAVKEAKDAKLAIILKKHTAVPYVADVHFHQRLALAAIDNGFDAIRLNPLNICKKAQVREIARFAKSAGVSIRVGVNSGGFRKNFSDSRALAKQMAESALDYLKLLEAESFFDIMISLKGSDVVSTVLANKIVSRRCNYPMHLGVTATGTFLAGVVKSCLGIGGLLNEGIGNIIRVSLTAPSFWEARAAKEILVALGLRRFGPEVISCPTCSRCEVNLIKVVDKFNKELKKTKFNKNRRIAIMGCVVNGPGEAYQADIGVAFGKKKAVIFRKDKILKNTTENNVVGDLLKELQIN